MTRSALSIITIAIISLLSACGGGGGGGGGGGSSVDINTQTSITNTNFGEVAGLAVRSNLIVADSPNYNEGFPATVVGETPRNSVNVMNMSRMQLVEISKVKPSEMVSAVLPIGAAPQNGPSNCGATAAEGTKTKTYIDSDNELITRNVDDKLTIDYSGCKLDLQQEAQNCVQVSDRPNNLTLNGRVETLITGVSGADYTTQLTYTNLVVTGTRGSSTINGNIVISVVEGTPKTITLTIGDIAGLTTKTGNETERLRSATIKYTDDQQGCATAASNNAYTILNTVTQGEVASSVLGFVNVNVTADLIGDSDIDSGFPSSGSFHIAGAGGTNLDIVAAGGGKATVKINNNNACANAQTWNDLFQGLPGGCK